MADTNTMLPILTFGMLIVIFIMLIVVIVFVTRIPKPVVAVASGLQGNRFEQEFSQPGYDTRSLDQKKLDAQGVSGLTGTRDIPVFYENYDVEATRSAKGMSIQGRAGDNVISSESMDNRNKSYLTDKQLEEIAKRG